MVTLVFTLLFSSTSSAEWTKVIENTAGDTFYVDFERIRKDDNYVYYWELIDKLKPDEDGDLSYKGYLQGDCKIFRFMYLQSVYHKESMGRGTGQIFYRSENPKWNYPSPGSSHELLLEQVCNQ